MHETLKSNDRLNTTGSRSIDSQHDCSRVHVASPKPTHVRKKDCFKSLASTEVPSTKLGLYKALQPLLKLASPTRLDGLVLLLFCCIELWIVVRIY